MTTVPSNLVPTRITQLPEYQGGSLLGYVPYVLSGVTYKVQMAQLDIGTVTSVGQSFTGGLISVGGSPITGAGTLALTVAGTSGGIPYFSSGTTWATSAALAANQIVVGGGAGAAPSTTTSPNIGTATGTSLALGGATIGSNALAVTGTANISGTVTTGAIVANSDITMPNGNSFIFNASTKLRATADGTLRISDNAVTNSFTITAGAANLATFNGGITAGSNIFSGGNVQAASSSAILLASRSSIRSPSDGMIYLRDNANSAYSDLTIKDLTAASIVGSGNVFAGSAFLVGWQSRSRMYSTADGVIRFTNAAESGFTGLLLGPSGTAYSSLRPTGASGVTAFKTADGTADAGITASSGQFSGTLSTTGAIIAGATQQIYWSTRTTLQAPSNGAFRVGDNALTNSFTITAGASNLATFDGSVTSNGAAITSGTASTTQGSLVLHNTSANSVTLKSSNSTSAAYTITLPVDDGTSGQVLSTDGSGVTSWITASGAEYGTWTPGISFGGGTTGITYGTQTGTYVKSGRSVLYGIYVTLTSKGSSAGGAKVTGCPYTSDTTAPYSFVNVITGTNITCSAANTPVLTTYWTGSTTGIDVGQISLGTPQQLSDTAFTNTSYIYGSINLTTTA